MLANELGQTEGVTVFCDQPPQIGVVSFRLDAVDVVLTGTILDESSALPCAPACIARRRRTRISERSRKELCEPVSANSTPTAKSARWSLPWLRSGACGPADGSYLNQIIWR